MARKDTLDKLFAPKPRDQKSGESAKQDTSRVQTGAISSMSAGLHEMTRAAQVANQLKEKISSGTAVIELDAKNIDVSFVSDRLSIEIDPDFEGLVESIKSQGQKVPILVRPHPRKSNRYQVAYGHRRLKALAYLNKPVKAIVQELSNEELVIAQGSENIARKDLSFIEKAFFAKNMTDMGIDRSIVMSALSTDKSDLSRYIAVANAVPLSIAQAIGPAPKAGRPRWLKLVAGLTNWENDSEIKQLIKSDDFLKLVSDERFIKVFTLVTARSSSSKKAALEWKTCDGISICKGSRSENQVTLVFDERKAPDFGEYLLMRMQEIFEDYSKSKEKN